MSGKSVQQIYSWVRNCFVCVVYQSRILGEAPLSELICCFCLYWFIHNRWSEVPELKKNRWLILKKNLRFWTTKVVTILSVMLWLPQSLFTVRVHSPSLKNWPINHTPRPKYHSPCLQNHSSSLKIYIILAEKP